MPLHPPDTIALYQQIRSQGEFKAMRIDESVVGTTYFGFAPINTLNSEDKWQIKRLTEGSGLIAMHWADGNAEFDNIWDNRTGLVYL
jgi:hypothetical protein